MRTVLIGILYILGPLLIMWAYQRIKFLSKIGTVIMAYALGIIMSLSGLMHAAPPQANQIAGLQNLLQNLCVPLAIPLMLFSSDFLSWTKSFRKTLVAFFCGLLAAALSVCIAFFLFRNYGIAELDKAAGLMTGFYTGGTPNVAALNIALRPSAETFLLVNTFEIFITFFLLAFLIAGGYKLIRRVLVYIPEQAPTALQNPQQGDDFENYAGMFSKKNLKGLLLPMGCSVLIVAVSALLSLLLVPQNYQVILIILLITTLSIALSFWKKLRTRPKMFELGMYFILVFSTVVASQFQVSKIGGNASGLLLFIAVVLLLCFVLHLLLARCFKVDADLFTISAVGLIFSPPFVPTVASVLKSRRCLLSGIIVGLCGYATGTYLGILVYSFLHSL